jgi:hypothetical protein
MLLCRVDDEKVYLPLLKLVQLRTLYKQIFDRYCS